jgi:hypothetical protein
MIRMKLQQQLSLDKVIPCLKYVGLISTPDLPCTYTASTTS